MGGMFRPRGMFEPVDSAKSCGRIDLSAGLYSVVAVDELGCSDTNTVSLVDPLPWSCRLNACRTTTDMASAATTLRTAWLS